MEDIGEQLEKAGQEAMLVMLKQLKIAADGYELENIEYYSKAIQRLASAGKV